MANAIVSIVVTFILTGVVGNWLIQRWQYRNWVNQQKFLGEEKEYVALKELWEQLSTLAAKRLWRMRRVLFATTQKDRELLKTRLAEYDGALSEWNEHFNSMCVRLTLLARYKLTETLENQIQRAFMLANLNLERIVKDYLAGQSLNSGLVSAQRQQFNSLNRLLFEFNRDILRAVEKQRARTYYGVELEYNKSNLEKFRTWELLKALFKPRMVPLRVVRPASDLEPPIISRG